MGGVGGSPSRMMGPRPHMGGPGRGVGIGGVPGVSMGGMGSGPPGTAFGDQSSLMHSQSPMRGNVQPIGKNVYRVLYYH